MSLQNLKAPPPTSSCMNSLMTSLSKAVFPMWLLYLFLVHKVTLMNHGEHVFQWNRKAQSWKMPGSIAQSPICNGSRSFVEIASSSSCHIGAGTLSDSTEQLPYCVPGQNKLQDAVEFWLLLLAAKCILFCVTLLLFPQRVSRQYGGLPTKRVLIPCSCGRLKMALVS